MSDTLRDRIIRIQAEHIDGQLTNYDAGREECGCGRQGSATYREHLADAILAIPGIAVVELPEPDYEDSTGHGWNGDPAGGVYAHGGKVYDEEGSHTPAQARAVAANWLAAADYAERDQ